MVEVGARLQENNSKLQQITVGLRGSLPVKDWAYDVYYEHRKNDFTNVTHNDVSRSKFSAGISGCPAAYKQFVPNCVPVQAFGVGSITPAMRAPIGNLSELESHGVDASIAYPIPLPFANGPFGQSLDVRLLKFFDVPIDQNTDPSTYDTLGRFYFGSVRAKF